ncbi:MAG: hypothetical protein KAW45_02435 [Thermoplasmatales archaeon]|nr:hypothetical protein [Thermoplasmatales archaeon]
MATDPKLKEAVISLLDIYGGNRSKVAELLHMSRNTIANIADEEVVMQEPQESVSISSEEYQKVLERLEKVEVWRDEHIKKYNALVDYLNKGFVAEVNRLLKKMYDEKRKYTELEEVAISTLIERLH